MRQPTHAGHVRYALEQGRPGAGRREVVDDHHAAGREQSRGFGHVVGLALAAAVEDQQVKGPAIGDAVPVAVHDLDPVVLGEHLCGHRRVPLIPLDAEQSDAVRRTGREPRQPDTASRAGLADPVPGAAGQYAQQASLLGPTGELEAVMASGDHRPTNQWR
jgi:hypothetical protein